VIVQDTDKPFLAYEFEVALPEAVRVLAFPYNVGSFDSRFLEWYIQTGLG
jgi:hypothetical protein